jgi:cyclohexadienyl dehydratase
MQITLRCLASAVIFIAMSGCAHSQAEIRVGTTGDYRPYSFRAGEHDALEGIDIDLAHDLAQSLGMRVRFVSTSWSTLLDDLNHDRFDIAMSGISRTPAREKVASFSDGYALTGKTAIARCADRTKFDSLEKIDQPGVRVLVNPGGTNEQFARSHLSRAELVVVPDNRAIFPRLVAQDGDVMFTDSDEVSLQTHLLPTLCATMPGQEFDRREKAVLLKKDAPLRDRINAWLRDYRARGALDAVFQKHLGTR